MPTKKTNTKKVKESKKSTFPFNFQKIMQNPESYKSVIYGIVTVVVLFIVIFLGVRTLSQNKAEIDNNAAVTDTGKQTRENLYTVKEGETLWSIADKTYGDGFKWTEIAKANNITDATTLKKGAQIVLPSITPSPAIAKAATTPAPTQVMSQNQQTVPAAQKITGNKYTIVHGDNLWTIAVRAYGDGYRWTDIAKANSLSEPNLIFSGNVLTLPR